MELTRDVVFMMDCVSGSDYEFFGSDEAIHKLGEIKEKEEERNNVPLIIKPTAENKTEDQRKYEDDDNEMKGENQVVNDKNPVIGRPRFLRTGRPGRSRNIYHKTKLTK